MCRWMRNYNICLTLSLQGNTLSAMNNEADLLKTLLVNQQSIYSDFSTYTLAILATLLTAQFFANKYINKMQIRDQVNEYFSELSKKIIKENKKIITTKLDTEIAILKTKYAKEFNHLHYSNCRSFALHANSQKYSDIEIRWWLEALYYALRAGNDSGTDLSIDQIIYIHDKDTSWKTNQITKYLGREILEKIPKLIPTILFDKREKIIAIINEILAIK